MDKRSRKGSFSATLFIIVCCVTIGKESTAGESSTSALTTTTSVSITPTQSTETIETSSTPYSTTLSAKKTSGIITEYQTSSSTTYDTTTQNGTNTIVTTGATDADSNTSTTSKNVTFAPKIGSIPLWILTIVISVICGLLFLITITVIVCHRCHKRNDEEPQLEEQKMIGNIANSDVKLVRFENEYGNNSKKDLHQTHENENKLPNKECSNTKPSKKEGKTSIGIVSGRRDYDEVLSDGTAEGKSLREKDECQVSAKSKDVLTVLKDGGDHADIEANEGSSEKESSEQEENPVYTQPMKKHNYSHVAAKWSLNKKAQSSAKSENQNVPSSYENFYDDADVNAKKSISAENETLDMAYNHLDFDRGPDMGPKHDFKSQPFSIESVLLEDDYDYSSNSCREDRNAAGAGDLYAKVSARRKHDPEVDKDISGDVIERDDSNRKVAEQERVIAETDTNVYYNVDKLKDNSKPSVNEHNAKTENKTVEMQTLNGFAISSQKKNIGSRNKSKGPSSASGERVIAETDTNVYYNVDKLKDNSKPSDNEHNAKPENKTVEMQTLNGFAISSQKKDSGSRNKSKGPSSASGEVKHDNINVENMQNAAGFSPSRSVKNDGRKTKGGEMLKRGSKFRIKETSYEEVNPAKCQGSAKLQKSNRSVYEEVEAVLG